MSVPPPDPPVKSRPEPPTGLWSNIGLGLGVLFSLLSIGTLVYYLFGQRRAPGSRVPPKTLRVRHYPTPAPASPIPNIHPKQPSRRAPEIDPNAVLTAAAPAIPAGPTAMVLPQTMGAERAGSWITAAVVLISVILLGFSQLVLNLADWFGLNMSFLSALQTLNCAIPGFCDLRLPPYALVALIAALLAAVLFGWRLARLGLPVLSEIDARGVASPQIRRLFHWPLALTTAVFLICQAVVVYQAILGVSVEPILWLAGLVTAWVLIWQMTRRPGAPATTPTLWNIAYLAGIFALCLAAAAFVSGHWGLGIGVGVLTALLLGGDLYTHWRGWDPGQKAGRLAIPLAALCSFFLFSYGLNSWAWSILGDEYSFYDQAREFAHGRLFADLLSGAGVYGYHPILSSAWQGATMWLLGENGYGWRVSHSLLLAISGPLFYYFMRPVVGRGGALAAAALYGSAHVLLSFGKLGSNNAQVVVVMALTFAAFMWAARHGSLAGFALTGILVGLGFYTFGIARVYCLLIAIWLALYYFPVGWRPLRLHWANVWVWSCVVGLALLTAGPVLSTRAAWAGQLRQSLFNSEVASTPWGIFVQFLLNTFYTFSSFLYNNQNAVFVSGALADPITASLMVLGVAAILATWRHGWRIRAGLLGTYGLYGIVIGGMQQYSYPSITRMFSIVPFYALFAAVGLVAVWQSLAGVLRFSRRLARTVMAVAAAGLVGAVVLINVWISVDLSPRHTELRLPAVELQTAQLTGDAAGNGPPIFLVAPPEDGFWINKIFAVHDIPVTRYTHIYPRDALADDQLCQAGQMPAIVIIPASVPEASYVAAQIHDCWTGSQVRLIKDGRGDDMLYRVMNPSALAAVHWLPGYWIEEEPPTAELTAETPKYDAWQAYQPRGLTVAANGEVVVVEASTQSLLFFDPTGKITRVLKGVFIYPSDVAYLPNGNLVVADAGIGVMIFDQTGTMVLEIGGLSSPRGVYVTAAGEIYVADTSHRQIAQFDQKGEVVRYIAGGDNFAQPTSIAVSATGLIAVGDPVLGKITILNKNETILNQISIGLGETSDTKPALLWLPDGNLLYTDAAAGTMRLVTPEGQELKLWTGLQRPNDLALAPDGSTVYLLEAGADRVVPMAIP